MDKCLLSHVVRLCLCAHMAFALAQKRQVEYLTRFVHAGCGRSRLCGAVYSLCAGVFDPYVPECIPYVPRVYSLCARVYPYVTSVFPMCPSVFPM